MENDVHAEGCETSNISWTRTRLKLVDCNVELWWKINKLKNIYDELRICHLRLGIL